MTIWYFKADTYDKISERIKVNDWTHWEDRLPSSLARQIFIKGSHYLTVKTIFPAR